MNYDAKYSKALRENQYYEQFYAYCKKHEDNPEAMVELAFCFQYGYGVEKDEAKAVELYKKASEMGNDAAIRNLGFCYKYGNGTDKDLDKAFRLFFEAAQHGNIAACCEVGECYKEGLGTDVNIEYAIDYFQKCLKCTNSFDDNRMAEIWINLAECYKEQNDSVRMLDAYNNALKKYKIIANSNSKIGYIEYHMGKIRENYGIEMHDYNKAFCHYEKSLINGYIPASRKVAKCYEYGRGVEKDTKKAFSIIKKYSEKDDLNKILLGVYYDYGIGTKQDHKSAIAIYMQYINDADEFIAGIAKCCLGICYYHGAGIEKDINKALELFENNENLVAEYYVNEINKQNVDKIFLLSLLYRFDLFYGIKPDYKRAFEFCKEAYEMSNHEKYQAQLAEMYFTGKGVKKDYQKAYSLYLEAGDDKSKQILGEYCYYGCATTKDYDAAIKYFNLGIRNNNYHAILYMGLCYLHGKGVHYNVEYAIELFESVNNTDDLYGRYIIGIYALTILSNLPLYEEKEESAIQKLKILSKKSPLWENIFSIWNQIPTKKIAKLLADYVEKYLEFKYTSHIPYPFLIKVVIQIISEYLFIKKKHGDIRELKKEIFQLKKVLTRMQESIMDTAYEMTSNQAMLQKQIIQIDNRTRQMELQLHQVIYFAKNDLQKWLQQEKEKLAPFIVNNDEQAITIFANKVARYLNENVRGSDTLIQEETTSLQKLFGSIWDRLLPTTRTSLISAGILWNYCTDIGNNFDYSGVCISATSALESELKRVFYTGLQEYICKHYGEPSTLPIKTVFTIWPEKLLNKTIAEYTNETSNGAQITLTAGDSFTMGTLPYLFWDKDEEKRQLLQSRMKEYLQTIVKECYADNPLKYINTLIKKDGKTVRDSNSFVSQCEQIRKVYRNPAAHIGVMSWNEADDCYSAVVIGKTDAFRYSSEAKGLIMQLYEFLKESKP